MKVIDEHNVSSLELGEKIVLEDNSDAIHSIDESIKLLESFSGEFGSSAQEINMYAQSVKTLLVNKSSGEEKPKLPTSIYGLMKSVCQASDCVHGRCSGSKSP